MTTSWRCKLLGHKLTGRGERVPGKCARVRVCQRCKESVIEESHQSQSIALDPSMPCRLTRKCTTCGKVFSTVDNHHWSYWERTDAAKGEYTRYCHNTGCPAAEERKHEHQWEITSETTGYEFDHDQETSYGVTIQERRCKTCQTTETIQA